MAKRTAKEVERDYKRIKEIVDTTFVTSIKEVAKVASLSQSEVRTSLAKHPRAEKRILEKLEENRQTLKAKKAEEENELGNPEEVLEEIDSKPDGGATKEVVIDASISGFKGIEGILSEICKSSTKIILTSITIIELDKLQKGDDEQAIGARHILAMASEDNNNFQEVLIDETVGIPDDCIIKYCADNKEKTTLFTADKVMCLKARMHGVETRYFKKRPDARTDHSQTISSLGLTNAIQDAKNSVMNTSEQVTLYDAKKIEDKLVIKAYNTGKKSICVISNDCKYTSGKHEIKVGDDVYLATNKQQYVTFAHYRITSLKSKENCKLIFYLRLQHEEEISYLPNKSYRKFMRDFYRVHDFQNYLIAK